MSATGRSLAAETGYVRHPDDYYSTPAWCTRAILPHLTPNAVLDPCAGTGAILDVVMQEWGARTYGLEIDQDRYDFARARHGVRLADALTVVWDPLDATIVTNPPYALALEFVQRALGRGTESAFLLRLNWLASQKRASFHRANPCDVYVLPKRPSFTSDRKTDATEYCWMVWGPGRGGRWSILDL